MQISGGVSHLWKRRLCSNRQYGYMLLYLYNVHRPLQDTSLPQGPAYCTRIGPIKSLQIDKEVAFYLLQVSVLHLLYKKKYCITSTTTRHEPQLYLIYPYFRDPPFNIVLNSFKLIFSNMF